MSSDKKDKRKKCVSFILTTGATATLLLEIDDWFNTFREAIGN